jgi:hypothetical protein
MFLALDDQAAVSNLTPCQAYKSMKITIEAMTKKPMSALLNMAGVLNNNNNTPMSLYVR